MATAEVISINLLPNYQMEIGFATGEQKGFDLRPYLKYPAFSALADDNLFYRAHIKNGTVAWSDEIDISPDTLYINGKNINE